MENRYRTLRKHLDELSYRQPLSIESVPLVEKLLADLIRTTESLQHFKEVAQKALEERDNNFYNVEPYKCDNARLVKECNDLHLAFLQFREQTDKAQKELKHQIQRLEKEKSEFETNTEFYRRRIRDLELDSAKKTHKIVQLEAARKASNPLSSKSKGGKTSKVECTHSKSAPELTTTLLADQKIGNLSREITRLKDELLKYSEMMELYKNQLVNRDKEIERLKCLLEGGRPPHVLTEECCYKNSELGITKLTEEISKLKQEKQELNCQLKEALSKQHEAMQRALNLAERNKKLEKELQDIDEMALAVEAECNSNIQDNVQKTRQLRNELDKNAAHIRNMEKELMELKRINQQLHSDADVLKHEKQSLQKVVETALDEKKRMSDRINHFTIIENDLNLEIDRLVQQSTLQKRRIAELESQIVSGQFATQETGIPMTGKTKKATQTTKSPTRLSPTLSPTRAKGATKPSEKGVRKDSKRKTSAGKMDDDSVICRCGRGGQELADYIREHMDQLKSERDYYFKEYTYLQEQIKNMPDQPESSSDLRKKLNEKEQSIIALQQENREIMREKHDLMSRLEEAKMQFEDGRSITLNSQMKRLERERDLAREEIQRLEEERDTFRQRLKSATETHVADHEKFERALCECDEQVRKLEKEKRDLLSSQGARRTTITELEDQCECYREQAKDAQTELMQQRTLYNQLKTLHEQTDRALAECHSQLAHKEMELANLQERCKQLELGKNMMSEELNSLRNDLSILKNNMSRLEREKDELLVTLDDKTERIAMIDHEIRTRENKTAGLEKTIADLKKQLDLTRDDSSVKEQCIASTRSEIGLIRQELEAALRARDNAIIENKRLEDDLSAALRDGRTAHQQLALAKREIEDLKKQLQQYVYEVKQIEDLLDHKERERGEMLEQFRSLSHEATVLESTNHNLESQATDNKLQLNVALSHVTDLEHRMEVQNSMIAGYEQQIAGLTAQIASMETQISQYADRQRRSDADLQAVRDLCVKLDAQKDALMNDASERDFNKTRLQRDVDKLREEQQDLQNRLSENIATIQSLENLLSTSRQETVEQRLLNEDLQGEVQRLKRRIDDLQSKLNNTNEQLDMYQEKALDYSQQIKQLRREIAHERFSRSRLHEDDRHYPSL